MAYNFIKPGSGWTLPWPDDDQPVDFAKDWKMYVERAEFFDTYEPTQISTNWPFSKGDVVFLRFGPWVQLRLKLTSVLERKAPGAVSNTTPVILNPLPSAWRPDYHVRLPLAAVKVGVKTTCYIDIPAGAGSALLRLDGDILAGTLLAGNTVYLAERGSGYNPQSTAGQEGTLW